MTKAFLDEVSDDLLGPPRVHDACGKLISASDDLVTGDGAEGNSLCITWFESDRGTSGDVQPFPIGPGTVEGQARVGFDEVIVRSNL